MPENYAHPEAIVETEWVAQRLSDPSILIAEINGDLNSAYHKGHIPAAVGWGLHSDFEHPVMRDIPSKEQLEGLLGRSGADGNATVLLYGDGNNRTATWAFWVLRYYGHKDTRIINGGRKKWLDEGRPLSTDIPKRKTKTYIARNPTKSLRATKDYIVRHLGQPGISILDTRALEEYQGLLTSAPGTRQPDIERKGRIPGAIHLPWDEGATSTGAFKPAGELKRMYLAKSITPDKEVIPYCRLGVRASYSWFVLKYLLGYPKVRNYDGSWTEWGNAVGVPIERDK